MKYLTIIGLLAGLAACSNASQVTSFNAAALAGAKSACPGVVALAPVVNGAGVMVATANGVGPLAVVAAQGADTTVTAGCAAIEALPAGTPLQAVK